MRTWMFLAATTLVMSVGVARADVLVPPPQGARLILEVIADGVQIYACESKDQSFAWAFKSPEATLFDREGRQVGTHFAGPSWKANDGSVVAGEAAARAEAPDGSSIPWLLLRAKSHEGTGLLSPVAFVRRAETKAGSAPKAGCDAAHVGDTARMRYSALYQFYTLD